ncbi:DegQ family serine endoprotease [Hypericibacter sp.]|uniref:DegQ family serine endoprotease n=1 Tax=Hypericibacter sp. TaxID=2705401 RepID=UPI003D6CCAD0
MSTNLIRFVRARVKAPALRSAVLAAGIAALALQSGVARADSPASFADLAAKVTPAVVNIAAVEDVTDQSGGMPEEMPFHFPPGSPFEEFFKHFRNGQQEQDHNGNKHKATALGSGFIVDPAGYIVTNNHVIDGATDIKVTTADGLQLQAKLIGTDEKTDLALLKVESKTPLPFVSFGDSDQTRVGDWVLAVGNPFGLGGTVTTGIISARGRDIRSGPFDDFLQIDASINQGNSGGPTFNMNGQVVGINAAIATPNGGSVGIGFAIPSNLAKPVIAELKEHGKVERGWLGVRIQEVTPELAQAMGLDEPKGALVAAVDSKGPANGKLQAGDVVLSFNGQAIDKMRDLPRLVAAAAADSTAKVEVLRNHEHQTVDVTIGHLPTEARVAAADAPADAKTAPGAAEKLLGLRLVALDHDARAQFEIPDSVDGALIADVDQDGKAAEQGLRPGDVIERVADSSIKNPADVDRLVEQARKDQKKSVLMLISRQGDDLFLALDLSDA